MGLVCEKKFKTSKFIRQISNLPNELYVDLMSSSSSLEVKASGEKTPSNMIIEAKRLKSDKLFKIADDSLKSSNKVGKKCINVETENQLESAMCDEKHSPEISGGGNEKIIIGFTCKQCSTRTHHKMSKNAYKRGVVLIECPGCSNRHLIADNLGWFSDSPGVSVNVETMSTSQGVQVARKADSHCDKIAIEKLLSDLDEVDQ